MTMMVSAAPPAMAMSCVGPVGGIVGNGVSVGTKATGVGVFVITIGVAVAFGGDVGVGVGVLVGPGVPVGVAVGVGVLVGVGVGVFVGVGVRVPVGVGVKVGVALGVTVGVGELETAGQILVPLPAGPAVPQVATADTSHLYVTPALAGKITCRVAVAATVSFLTIRPVV